MDLSLRDLTDIWWALEDRKNELEAQLEEGFWNGTSEIGSVRAQHARLKDLLRRVEEAKQAKAKEMQSNAGRP